MTCILLDNGNKIYFTLLYFFSLMGEKENECLMYPNTP